MEQNKRIEEMKELIKVINKHNYNYYTLLEPSISDSEYDKLYYKLVDLENETGVTLPDSPTQRVGGDVLDKFNKHTHEKRLYSLDKVRSLEGLESWMQEMRSFSPDTQFSLEYKFDGLQLVLEYNDGIFLRATTRGNGLVGEDVTAQVKTIRSVPLSIKYTGKLMVQGEGMITQTNLKEYNKHADESLKNARNGVAGAIRNLDPKETAKRKLDYFCYSILDCDKDFATQLEMHEFLIENGFKTGDYFKLVSTIQDVKAEIDRIDQIKSELDVMIDGMVLKINDVSVREKIGYTNKFPKWAIAYKFEAQEVSTILNDVLWQVGRTGKITPIAIFEPVELGGATITRATLNNFDDIQKKRVSINSRILIRRSNEVIPEVLGLLEEFDNSKKIEEPNFCPSCGTELIKKGPLLYCPNRDGCIEQVVDRLTHFTTRNALNIEGLSEKTILSLHKNLNVSEPSDLYKLTKEQLMTLDKVKDKKAQNIVDSIAKSKNVELGKFIFAIGIPEVGEKTAKDIAKKFKTLENVKKATLEELLQIKDIGEIIARNVVDFFADNKNLDEIDRLIDVGIVVQEIGDEEISENSEFSGKTIVLTGSLLGYTRQQAQDIIEKLGGTVTSSVSKNTNLVIAGAEAGSKLIKANALGIKVINEDEFVKLIEKSNNAWYNEVWNLIKEELWKKIL